MKIEVKPYHGRTVVWIDGEPRNLRMYSPPAMGNPRFATVWPACIERFVPHDMDVYLVSIPQQWPDKFELQPFWDGDTVSRSPFHISEEKLDEAPRFILEQNPEAMIMLRFMPRPPKNWFDLHPEDVIQTAQGTMDHYPSLASANYLELAQQAVQAYIGYCESRPWGERVLGYINYQICEGTYPPLSDGWLYDYSPVMLKRWRQFLQQRYGDEQSLRRAHGDDSLSFETAALPRDPLLGKQREVSQLLFWQDEADNCPMLDYLLLMRELFHENQIALARSSKAAAPEKLMLFDTMKLPMQGWSNTGFFDMERSWPVVYAENLAGSGNMDVLELLDVEGLDGVCTPYDYQVRGAGGIFEPEGIADSVALRSHTLFLVEQDIRTYAGGVHNCGMMRDLGEFEAVTWRDLATSLTRGFMNYLTDHNADYYSDPAMHPIVHRQMNVLAQSVNWPHETVPGIAMILDEQAIMETNGSGHVYNELNMWEQKTGLSRCGVPYRIYLLDDLKRDNFPEHAVFYFPNLHRVDEERLALLREKVLCRKHLVVWGPGSGISDGHTISVEHASRLTGFSFTMQKVNAQRRVQICNFEHPITRGLAADCIFGSAIAYGPVLYPTDGLPLGWAWSKFGGDDVGLALKSFDNYHAVFTTAGPLPADLWRGLARFAGAHIYCESNDVLLTDSSLVALHSLKSERKRLALPGTFEVIDLIAGELVGRAISTIEFELQAPGTVLYRLEEA